MPATMEAERKIELINGREFMMAPAAGTLHNSVGMNLAWIIRGYLRGKRCKVFYETEVWLDEANHFIPDLLILCDRSKIRPGHIEGAPDLVIEILSPSTRKNDVGEKKDAYERSGVKEYWLVSPKEETVDVYLLKDGKFVVDNSYHNYSEDEWEGLSEAARAAAKLSLKVSLYDDFEIQVKDIFED